MRHAKKRLQLNRFTSWHRATLSSMVRAVLIHQRITTTKTKAKAVKPLLEKLISLGKENSLAAKRRAYRILKEHRLLQLLFNDIAPRFVNRNGGYARIYTVGRRRGDNAEMAILALTEIKEKQKKQKKKPEKTQSDIQEPVKETKPPEQKITKAETPVKEKPPIVQKPSKKFLGGLRKIFKKERDSL